MTAIGKAVSFNDNSIQNINCIISNTTINDTISNFAQECATNVLAIHDTVNISDISTRIYNFYENNIKDKDEPTNINIYIFTNCIYNKSHAIFLYEEEKSAVGLEFLTLNLLETLKQKQLRFVNIFAIINNVTEGEGNCIMNYDQRNIDAMKDLHNRDWKFVTYVRYIILDRLSTFEDTFNIIKEDFKHTLKTNLNANRGTNLLKNIVNKLNQYISQLVYVVY